MTQEEFFEVTIGGVKVENWNPVILNNYLAYRLLESMSVKETTKQETKEDGRLVPGEGSVKRDDSGVKEPVQELRPSPKRKRRVGTAGKKS